MNRQIIDDTARYIRQELSKISQDLTWADGKIEEGLRLRQNKLKAELDRIEAMKISQTTPQASSSH